MSTKEPKKRDTETVSDKSKTENQDSKPSDSIDDWLDNMDQKTSDKPSKLAVDANVRSQQITDQEDQVSGPSVDELLAEFVRQLPGWVNKPWMYVKPTHSGHLSNWFDSWKQLILKYTTVFTKHIVTVYDLQTVHPFTHQTSGKDLSIDEIKTIIDHMVEDNLAKWLDDDSNRARIYFKTDAQWAEILYQFTLDHGYATDIMTLYDLQALEQKWSELPDSELRLVLEILVKEDKAEWVGKDRDTIQFKI